MVQNGYTEYDSVKIKLRVGDDSMKDEIQLYMHEIDDLINNRLRAKLGSQNIYGSPIILPLTDETIPVIPIELKAIAHDLVVAKIRLQNSEKPLLWDSAVKVLDNYLERVYGWTRAVPFQPERTITITPTTGIIGATVTLGTTNFQPLTTLIVSAGGITAVTTPTDVITDTLGVVSGVTFPIPTGVSVGTIEITVVDDLSGITTRFVVTA